MALEIHDVTPRVRYVASSGQTTFAIPFFFLADADVVVEIDDVAVAQDDMTITGEGVQAGGEVVLDTGATTGQIVVIYRDMALERLTDYSPSGDFDADVLDTEIDRLLLMIQQQVEISGRGLRFTRDVDTFPAEIDLTVAQRAGKVLGFDAGGDPVVLTLTGSGDPALRADLAASSGSALVGFLQAGTGAVSRSLQARGRDWVSVLDFMTSAEAAACRAGCPFDASLDALPNVVTKIQAAIDYVTSTFGKGVVYFPSGIYRCTAPIVLKNGVTLEGDGQAWWTITGAAWNNGSVIFKAHNGHGISGGLTTTILGCRIRNLSVFSDKGTYPTGDGIHIEKCVELRVELVNVFRPGGNGIYVGNGLIADTSHNYLTDCYVNNPGAACYVYNSIFGRLDTLKSDGGTWGIIFGTGGVITISRIHLEGTIIGGIQIGECGFIKFVGQNYIVWLPGQTGTVGVQLAGVGSDAYFYEFDGLWVNFANTYSAASRGIDGLSTANHDVKVTNCRFDNAGRGVETDGIYWIMDNCTFQACGRAVKYSSNSGGHHFTNNRCYATREAYIIEIGTGQDCVYDNNHLDVPLHSSGSIAHPSNTARGNKGWVTKNAGVTGAIATGATVAHGLAGTPVVVHLTPQADAGDVSATWDATNITIAFDGGGTKVFAWTAILDCEIRS